MRAFQLFNTTLLPSLCVVPRIFLSISCLGCPPDLDDELVSFALVLAARYARNYSILVELLPSNSYLVGWVIPAE